jgi:hypothetical protein
VKGNIVQWDVTIPPNASARLPLSSKQAARFKIDGMPLTESAKIKMAKDGANTYDLPAGSYKFEVALADTN